MNDPKSFRYVLGPLSVSRIVPKPALFHRRPGGFWKVA